MDPPDPNMGGVARDGKRHPLARAGAVPYNGRISRNGVLRMIVVTGGAGFIGSNLLAGLEAAGARGLVVCDRLGTGDKWRNIAKRDLATISGNSSNGAADRRHHLPGGGQRLLAGQCRNRTSGKRGPTEFPSVHCPSPFADGL